MTIAAIDTKMYAKLAYIIRTDPLFEGVADVDSLIDMIIHDWLVSKKKVG
jgi:hypothetical protein